MPDYRVIAIPTKLAQTVRTSHKAPVYGHPAHTEIATGYGPCRHCLRTFRVGAESRILFTYDSFFGIEKVPLPGPIFIHADSCDRYPEHSSYPPDLPKHAAVMTAYAKGQTLITKLHVGSGCHESAVQQLLNNPGVDYIQVHDLEAGCYDFRIEPIRQPGANSGAPGR